ncbi:hypothetical protein [Neobacillus niacini]|uniref:hypothetical protein n=1 Tax=Neobacillus niacini TaxID=86668 RepID=UPI001C8EF681|nr:hypothetical protein [Neobacillus niacini]MBY0144332.1 hypothetical protein [Neobacillus niacini]
MNYSKNEGKELDPIEQLKEQQRVMVRCSAVGEQKETSVNERLFAQAIKASEERHKSSNTAIDKLLQQQREIMQRAATEVEKNPLENDQVERLEEYQSEIIRDLETVQGFLEQQQEMIKRLISKVQK